MIAVALNGCLVLSSLHIYTTNFKVSRVRVVVAVCRVHFTVHDECGEYVTINNNLHKYSHYIYIFHRREQSGSN